MSVQHDAVMGKEQKTKAMDLKRIIELLKIERECVGRSCDRDCGNCDLVQDSKELIAAFDGAIDLLKAQEPATVEPKRIELADETKAWLDKMDAVDALGSIASICIDWDGYRTADGLGGLINEIWTYARYCADRLNKTLGAVEPVPSIDDGDWLCGNCYQSVIGKEELDASGFVPVKFNFCPNCGRAVKWK